MDEDLELNGKIKAALESKPPLVWRPPREGDRHLGRHLAWTATLLAASLAIVASFTRPAREASAVEDAILLLSEIENVDLETDGTESPESLLVAWQDAGLGSGS